MTWWRTCVVVTACSLAMVAPDVASGLALRHRDGLRREGRGAPSELDGVVYAEGHVSESSGRLLGGDDSTRVKLSLPVRLIVRLCSDSTLDDGEEEKFSVVINDGRSGTSFQVRIHSPHRYQVVSQDPTFDLTIDSETSRGSADWLTGVESYSVIPVVFIALERVGSKPVLPSNEIASMRGIVDGEGRVTLSWEDRGNDPTRATTTYQVEVRRRPRFRPAPLLETTVEQAAVPGSAQSVTVTHGRGAPFAVGDTLRIRIRLRREGEAFRDTWSLRSSFSLVLDGDEDDPMAGLNVR